MSSDLAHRKWISINRIGDSLVLSPHGAWQISNLPEIEPQVRSLQLRGGASVAIDATELTRIDTAGALILFELASRSGFKATQINFKNLTSEQEQLVELVRSTLDTRQKIRQERLTPIQEIGKATLDVIVIVRNLLSVIGETFSHSISSLIRPGTIRLKELFVQLELTFLDAIPIAALVTFLIGIVVAYLFAIQIEKYGANIFIVDAVALAMCRELSPIIVAIIVAGRSGSAFTAHIGTMKLNEEIDALLTLGLSPMRVLVLPRLFALVIALPLLVFVGDVVGILGAMIIADLRLNITGVTFIERLQVVLPIKSLLVGLVKAPVFAAFIAVIGCRMGLSVENNARSVGLNTTSTVVQSIVSVILLNAAFAIIFVELGI